MLAPVNITPMQKKDSYEAPKLEVVGTLHDITKAGGLVNSDDGKTANNAFPNPSA